MSEHGQRQLMKQLGLQTYDTGGIVPGPRGMPQMAMVHGGETILPTHKGSYGAMTNIFVELDGRTIAKAIGEPLVGEIRVRTGMRI